MTDLTFSTVAVPPDPEDAPAPDISPGADLHCLVCGKPLEYGGKGRKPKYCDEHKKGVKRENVRSSSVKNERLASQATDALMQINGMVAFLCHLTGLPMTASAINGAEAGLREQVHAALITDPALCETILKGGTQSSKVSLVLAYGMFAVAVVPVATTEIKARRVAKELAAEAVEE